MAQKTHNHGTDGNRYFWNVTTTGGSFQYRSRHSTSSGVRKTLTKMGHTVTSVKQARA